MVHENGKKCIVQLFKYCKNIKKIFDLQQYFPDYFEPNQPDWFRRLLRFRNDIDSSHIAIRIEKKCLEALHEKKKEYFIQGKKYQHIVYAVNNANNMLETINNQLIKFNKKFTIYFNNLNNIEIICM
jgi:hypothetical protein